MNNWGSRVLHLSTGLDHKNKNFVSGAWIPFEIEFFCSLSLLQCILCYNALCWHRFCAFVIFWKRTYNWSKRSTVVSFVIWSAVMLLFDDVVRSGYTVVEHGVKKVVIDIKRRQRLRTESSSARLSPSPFRHYQESNVQLMHHWP